MGLIPDRWLDYTSVNKPIKDVPIILFKTPLSERYNKRSNKTGDAALLEADQEFTPGQLMEKIKEMGYELAVVIDLTYTYRYYNGELEFDNKHKVQYEKVKCEGQRVPSDVVFSRVADIISDVIYQHGKDGKKICGVHCTHGVNRSGYLVARYLIEYLEYKPEDAIKALNEARGHDLERENYLQDLRDRASKNLYNEWRQKRERFDPHVSIDFDDLSDNVNSFEKSKEDFFKQTYRYDTDKKWSRYDDWDHRDSRPERTRHYRGRYDNSEQRQQDNGRTRWYNNSLDRRSKEEFSDDGVFMPTGDSFVLDRPLTDQLPAYSKRTEDRHDEQK